MKSMLKNMRKKVAEPEIKVSTPTAEKTAAGKEQPSHVVNGDLPRHRSARGIDRSVVATLNTLRDTSAANRSKLFIRKVRLCCYVFEFTDQPDSPQVPVLAPTTFLFLVKVLHSARLFMLQDAQDKEIKRATLLELVNYLSVFKPGFGEEELEVQMFVKLRHK